MRYLMNAFILPAIAAAALLSTAALPAPAQSMDARSDPASFTMEFRDADITDVLRAVGQALNLNMIIGENVSGTVTISLKDVDLLVALDAILKTKGLTYVREGNIMRVLSIADATDADMDARVFPLGHANSKEVLAVVERVKSDRARVSMDTRLNAIIVRDLTLNLDQMERLLRDIDVRVAQVLIEAKIVEVSSTYARELGIQWGGRYTMISSRGTTTLSGGLTGLSGTTAVGAGLPAIGSTTFYPQTGDIGPSGNAYVVNLPAAVGPGSGGVLGVTFGKLGGRLSLDLQLSAMVTTGNGRILSNPRVMTQNNREARISSGVDIPVKVVSTTPVGTTAEVRTISASLMLSTTPTVTQDNRVAMAVKVEKSEPDFTNRVDGIPTIARRSANADLVVNNGETVVLGGIYTKNEGETEAGVPLLSRIPVLGWLFKKRGVFDTQSELLIFITPTIVLPE